MAKVEEVVEVTERVVQQIVLSMGSGGTRVSVELGALLPSAEEITRRRLLHLLPGESAVT